MLPGNVLLEGGAGEMIRRRLLTDFDVHTALRLPSGIFYAGGVTANVLLIDEKPASETPWTSTLWGGPASNACRASPAVYLTAT